MTNKRPSTGQLLVKIPNYPCLYRHGLNDTYYGIKKTGGKRKEHSLETADRKIAERKLKAWIAEHVAAGLASIEGIGEITRPKTLNQHLHFSFPKASSEARDKALEIAKELVPKAHYLT